MLSIRQVAVLLANIYIVQGFRTYSSETNDISIGTDEEPPINTATTITYYYSELTLVGNCRLLQDESEFQLQQFASSFLAKFAVVEPSLQIVHVSCDRDFVVRFYTSHTSLGMYSLYYCPDELFCEVKFDRIKFTVEKFQSEIPQVFEFKPIPGLNRRNTYLVLIASSAFGLVMALMGGVMALCCGWFSSKSPKYVYTLGIAAYNETPKIFSSTIATTSATTSSDAFPAKDKTFLEILHKNGDYDSVDDTATNDSFSSDEEFEISQEIFSLARDPGSVPDFQPPLPTSRKIQPDQEIDSEARDDLQSKLDQVPSAESKQQSVAKTAEPNKNRIGLTNIRFVDDNSPSFRIETDL